MGATWLAKGTMVGNPTETLVRRASFWGQSGWFQVPQGWYTRTDANRQIWACEKSNWTGRQYACKVNEIGYLVFQDLLRELTLNTH